MATYHKQSHIRFSGTGNEIRDEISVAGGIKNCETIGLGLEIPCKIFNKYNKYKFSEMASLFFDYIVGMIVHYLTFQQSQLSLHAPARFRFHP